MADGKFVRVGSAIVKPGEDDKANKFVPVWKQTVTDEQGRRRLHGAFTGGFSAGYGNTVGSKEGPIAIPCKLGPLGRPVADMGLAGCH